MLKATSLLPYTTAAHEADFWSRVNADGPCWEWQGPFRGNGYGIFYIGGRSTGAHRYAYEILVAPIAPGLVVDHLCRNRVCVNPDHLEPVTHAENLARGMALSAILSRAGACLNGHDVTNPSNVWVGPKGDKKCRKCAQERRRRRYLKHKEANQIPDRRQASLCTEEGCGGRHYALGFCKKHYQRHRSANLVNA